MPKCLPVYAIRGLIVTAETRHAYLVDGAGKWHYITNNWNCVRARHNVYAEGVPWDQIKAYGRFQETTNATCSM